jgi:uncharacterized protein (UPF0332 family)
MTFDWNLYLQLAKRLSAAGDDASKRSAVSRAYYSAFHAASSAIKSHNVATDPRHARDRHQRIWIAYINSSARGCRQIGSDGQRLKYDRQEADYDPDSRFNDARVQQCIAKAESLAANTAIHIPESFGPTNKNPLGSALSYMRRFFGF